MKRSLGAGFLVVLLAGAFLAGRWYQNAHLSKKDAGTDRKVLYYVDPMNPALKSDKPGVAPCGMPLEAVYADDTSVPAGMRPGAVRVTEEQQQLIGVKVATVRKGPWSDTVRVLGRVAADEDRVYRVTAATDGWVKSTTGVTTGSLTRKDELLATFYAPEFFPAIKAFLYGMRSLERFETSGTETPQQLELTSANIDNYRVSLLNLGMSEHQIDEMRRTRHGSDRIELRAPEAGFVLRRNVSLGQRFVKGEELYKIADLRRVWILADVFENEAAYFRPGTVVRVLLPNQGKTFRATVSAVLPQFDAVSRTLKVRLVVDNPGLLLRPDMFVDVDLPVSFPAAIAVPVDAVRASGLHRTVYIDLGNGFFEPRDVETGWRFGDRVEIVRGLAPGDRIVVSGNFLIDSESRMRAGATPTAGADDRPPASAAAEPVSVAKAAVARDLVCGMYFKAEAARAAGLMVEYRGTPYYFCSEECKSRFQKDPERYLKEARKSNPAPVAGPEVRRQ
jgi:membrane fusion protein, copper/silver efflux system